MKHTQYYTLLFVSFILSFNISFAQTLNEKIRINQVGFFTEGIKKAIAVDFSENTFEIWKSDESEKIFSGILTQSNAWNAACESNIKIADFTSLKTEGSYTIIIGDSKSFTFSISNNALDTVAKAQMKYYYFNRSGYELLPEHAGIWARKAGHANTQVKVLEDDSRTINMNGGWYDAGDYGLYVNTAAIAACQIMMSYEQFPEYWNRTEWNIPESGNGVPDILDEVKYELKWLYKMKDTDNGVWYKATSKGWPGVIMPEFETRQFYCMVKSATAAYDYAATFAFAARIFENFSTQYPGFADSCLNAAKDAWIWASQNELTYPNSYNPKNVVTGEYSENINDYGSDNKVLAGVELYITTGDSTYLKPVISIARKGFVNGEANWYEKRPIACMQLALIGDKEAQAELLNYANSQIEYQKNNGYNVNIGKTDHDFNWGSNRRISNRGMSLMVAYILTKDKKYLNGVTNSMDYILGRNATSYCFITGFGTKRVTDPHHRISGADGIEAPIPGLPMQGPYYGNMGVCSPNIVSTCAAKNYIDNECSYSSNELSIDQASPNVFNLGGLNYFLNSPINVSINSPENNNIYTTNKDITIHADVSNTIGTVTKVDFYINNILEASFTHAPFEYTLTNPTNNLYKLTAIASNSNKDSSTTTHYFTVGNSNPKLCIITPSTTSHIASGSNVTIEASAFDVDGSITKVEFYSNSELINTVSDSPYIHKIKNIADGNYNINVIAYDNIDSLASANINISANCNNLALNGDFSNSINSWLTKTSTDAAINLSTISFGNNENTLKASILKSGIKAEDIELQYPLSIVKGNTYNISYYAKADTISIVECNFQHESDPWDIWTKYVSHVDTIKDFKQLYTYKFTATHDDDSTKFKVLLGNCPQTSVYIDNVIISLCENSETEISSITFIKTNIESSTTYTPTLQFFNKNQIQVRGTNLPEITWLSSNEDVATVDKNGKVKMVSSGTATITAFVTENSSIEASFNVASSYVGIEKTNTLNVTVTPRITKNKILIKSNEKFTTIQIVSIKGTIVKEIALSGQSIKIDISELPANQYILKINSHNDKQACIPIVKQ